GEVLGEQLSAFQMLGGDAEGIVVGGDVVHLQRQQLVHAAGFEQGGHVAADDRVLELSAALLACIAQVGRDHLESAGAGILQRAAEEQQLAQLVVDALFAIAVQTVEHHHLTTVDRRQRAALVLAILEDSLLVGGQVATEASCYSGAVVLAAGQCEQQGSLGGHGIRSSACCKSALSLGGA